MIAKLFIISFISCFFSSVQLYDSPAVTSTMQASWNVATSTINSNANVILGDGEDLIQMPDRKTKIEAIKATLTVVLEKFPIAGIFVNMFINSGPDPALVALNNKIDQLSDKMDVYQQQTLTQLAALDIHIDEAEMSDETTVLLTL